MKNLFASLIRTYVPWLAGVIIGWLVALGIPLDPEVEVQVTLALMGLASTLYYVVARLVETHVSPRLGWLLGSPRAPMYSADDIIAAHALLDEVEQEADEQAALSRADG